MADKFSVKQIKVKMEFLKGDRTTWESHWQEVSDYFQPNKNTVTNKKSPGQKRSVTVLDSTGIQSNELLAGALHGLLTNPNALWHEYTTGDVDLDREDDVREFLQYCARQTHNALNNSNFQTEIHETYLDICSFGTNALLIEEDDVTDVRFSARFIGEYCVVENHLGFIDQIYREWKWPAAKIAAEFGVDVLPKKLKDDLEKGSETLHCVIQAVYPRILVDQKSQNANRYISQYVLPDENVELREAGFREFPYVVPRWTKATGETYGRSPAMTALPEMKTLNIMTETMIQAAQKVVDPPMQMEDDGVILPIITRPGGLNFRRPGSEPIAPLFNYAQVDFGYEALAERRKRVREAFYIDQLRLQQGGPQMTATEVLQRTEEQMRLLGPMLGRQQSELLRPLIDRVFAILVRKGKLDMRKMPAILAGRKLDVRYSSLIAKAQRLNEGQNLMRVMEALIPIINVDAKAADNLNGDAAFRVVNETFGGPQEIVRNKKDVDQIRQARAQAQQAQMQAEQQAQEAQQAPEAAKTMQALSGQTG